LVGKQAHLDLVKRWDEVLEQLIPAYLAMIKDYYSRG
jgi:hypothetical protein